MKRKRERHLPVNEPGSGPSKEEPKKHWANFWWLYLLTIAALFIPGLFSGNEGQEISWQKFEKDILSRKAAEKIVVVNNEIAEIYIKKELAHDPQFKDLFKEGFGSKLNEGPQYMIRIGSVESFDRKLDEAQKNLPVSERIETSYVKKNNWIRDMASWILPFVLLYLLWNFMIRRSARNGVGGSTNIFNFGKSRPTLVENEKSKISFNDVAGLEEAKVEIMEIVDFLKNPETYPKLGAKIPKGVILVGPPGTGKTLLAKAIAGEARVPFFSISGSEFVEMFVGVGASRVRDLFNRAKEKSPCIIFIDEIDAIGRSRGRGAYLSGANDERESTLNQLLTEMDGFSTNSGVIVLAATNRADMLDAALLRPGRFDRHIYLELPNQSERAAIFIVHMRPLAVEKNINIQALASQTPGFSGADIANICNEAALIAARSKKLEISWQDFMDAIDRVIAGLEKKSKIISAEEKRIIAFHEAGHALVSWKLIHVDPLLKVSIIPRGKSLGAAWYLPEERQLRSKAALEEHLSATLGGRAAEEVIFGEISTGALDDLEKVTREAYMMVTYYGFNEKIGNISYYDSSGRLDMSIQKPYSEATARLIDEEVRNLVSKAYNEAKAILIKNRNALVQIAELLLKKEIVLKADIENILGQRMDQKNADPERRELVTMPPLQQLKPS